MRREKWLVLCIALLLMQLVACERGKTEENAPAPVSARTGTDGNKDQVIQEGDQLYFTPAVLDTANFLGFKIATAKEYECSNSYLQIDWPQPGEGLSAEIKGVVAGNQCDAGKATAKGFIATSYGNEENYKKNIEIRFQNKTYKGSFKKTGKHFEFTWPYESGVVFTTKTL